jgi:hypothetical protein
MLVRIGVLLQLQYENGTARPRHYRPTFVAVAQSEATYPSSFVLPTLVSIIWAALSLLARIVHCFGCRSQDLEYVGVQVRCGKKFGKRG